MGERYRFRERRTKVADGVTYDDVEFGPILKDRLYEITRIGAEDETSDPSGDLRLYIKGHGYEHWLRDLGDPGDATLQVDVDGTFLVMGESLVARFTGAAGSDLLRLYVEGWWQEGASVEA